MSYFVQIIIYFFVLHMSIKTDGEILSSWKGVSMEVNGMNSSYKSNRLSSNACLNFIKISTEILSCIKYVIEIIEFSEKVL